MSRRTSLLAGAVAVLLAGTGTAIAGRTIPEPAPELPVFHGETARGSLVIDGTTRARRADKVVDGAIADWTGIGSRLGGTSVRSHGELIYSDYLFDAFGADDGGDAERLATLDPLNEGVPETYRLDPIFQLDLADELGVPVPVQVTPEAEEQYGDAGDSSIGPADLLELRLSADGGNLYLLARTTTMTDPASTGLLLLLDSVPGSPAYQVPFGSGLSTSAGDVAVFIAASGSRAVDLATGVATPLTSVAVNPDAYTNAIEAAVPLKAIGAKRTPARVAAVAGLTDGAGGFAKLANVAFRSGEPVRTWMDKQQALELGKGSIDAFFADVDPGALHKGATDAWHPGPGYYERVFTSTPEVSKEGGQDGLYQHYGVYVSPASVLAEAPVPATFWLHWRGGKAHSAATVSPRIMRDFGDGLGGVVIAPRGRGSSTWYLGRGHVDVMQVREDALQSFAIDENRVYVSGHSMGGFGSYLMSTMHPDWFAAALPVAGPVTQGMWTGLDFPNCDDFAYDDYSFCYVQTNNGDARTQHTRRLLKNLRNVPIGIYQGGADELVWTSGVTRQVEELVNLGYRHRYYLFPSYEHYSHPVVDEWAEGVRYLKQFTRDPSPAHVTYVRDMPFERSVESGANQHDMTSPTPPELPVPIIEALFDFDSAYWMSGLTPADPVNGVASFDGRSLALPDPSHLALPEAGGPSSVGQAGPYVMTGLQWLADPLAAPASPVNGFELTLSGVSSVTLDPVAMGLDLSKELVTNVTTDRRVEVHLGDRTLVFEP